MDRVVAARKLLAELVKSEQIEVRRAEIVGRDLAQLIETLGRPPSGKELEEWLDEHAQVTELYAGPTLLDELVYRHLTPPPPDLGDVPDARHPELERQLREAPETTEPYLVYADWLQEHGDPLGELIALGVAAETGTDEDGVRFERFRRLHEARFLRGLASQLAERVALRWRNGLVHAIEMLADQVGSPQWEQLLRLRVCEAVQAITLRGYLPADLDHVIHTHASPSLRTLRLDTQGERLPEHLLKRDLKALSIENVTAPLVAFIKGAPMPHLVRLELAIGDDVGHVLPLLRALEAPALTQLVLRDGLLDPAQFAKIAKLPLAENITSLTLANLELADDQLRAYVRKRGGFTNLTELDVRSNELSRDGLAAAQELATTVVSGRQHKRGSGNEKRVRKFAGSRLQVAEGIIDPKAWRRSGVDGEIRWARYRGDADYELFVSADLQRYGCSCPSSIQPCKHVVALALIAERTGLPEAPSNGIEDRVARPTYGLDD